MQPQPQQVVYIHSTPVNNVDRLNYSKAGMPLAVCQLSLGILCAAINIADFIFYPFGGALFFSGVWCGVMFIVTGSLGIGAAATKRKCLITSFMVMSIISAVFTAGIFTTSSMQVMIASGPGSPKYGHWGNPIVSKPLNITLLCLASVELITAIASAAVCCKAVCCVQGSPTVGIHTGPQYQQCQYINQPGIQTNVPGGLQGVTVCNPQPAPYAMQPNTVKMSNGQQMATQQDSRGQQVIVSGNSPPPSYKEKQ